MSSLDIIFENARKHKLKGGGTLTGFGIENKSGMNIKSRYYIPVSYLIHQVYRGASNSEGTFKFNADFIREKKSGKISVEYIKDVKAKYILCIARDFYEFPKIVKRNFPVKRMDDDHLGYYIPLSFVRTLLSDIDGYEIESELNEISIFKYGGDYEFLQESSIFTLSDAVKLCHKLDDDAYDITIMV